METPPLWTTTDGNTPVSLPTISPLTIFASETDLTYLVLHTSDKLQGAGGSPDAILSFYVHGQSHPLNSQTKVLSDGTWSLKIPHNIQKSASYVEDGYVDIDVRQTITFTPKEGVELGVPFVATSISSNPISVRFLDPPTIDTPVSGESHLQGSGFTASGRGEPEFVVCLYMPTFGSWSPVDGGECIVETDGSWVVTIPPGSDGCFGHGENEVHAKQHQYTENDSFVMSAPSNCVEFLVENTHQHMKRMKSTRDNGGESRKILYMKKYQELQVKTSNNVTVDIAKQFFTMLLGNEVPASGVRPEVEDIFRDIKINDMLRKKTGVTSEDWSNLISQIKKEKRFITSSFHTFQSLDGDGSGNVTVDEAAEMLCGMATSNESTKKEAKDRVRKHLIEYDSDNSGVISFQEFWQMIQHDRRNQKMKNATKKKPTTTTTTGEGGGKGALALESRQRRGGISHPPTSEWTTAFRKVLVAHAMSHADKVEEERLIEEKKKDDAAAKIQGVQRGKLERKMLLEQKEAVIKIQAVQRGKLDRKVLTEKNEAAGKIQSIQRGKAQRKEIEMQKEAALKIQSVQRGKQDRVELNEKKQAAAKIQAVHRGNKDRASIVQRQRNAQAEKNKQARLARLEKIEREKRKAERRKRLGLNGFVEEGEGGPRFDEEDDDDDEEKEEEEEEEEGKERFQRGATPPTRMNTPNNNSAWNTPKGQQSLRMNFDLESVSNGGLINVKREMSPIMKTRTIRVANPSDAGGLQDKLMIPVSPLRDDDERETTADNITSIDTLNVNTGPYVASWLPRKGDERKHGRRQRHLLAPTKELHKKSFLRRLQLPEKIPSVPVIVILGDLASLEDDATNRLRDFYRDGILRTAAQIDALVIDGGLESGVAAIEPRSESYNQVQHVCQLGISPNGITDPLSRSHSHQLVISDFNGWDDRQVEFVKHKFSMIRRLAGTCRVVCVLMNNGHTAWGETLEAVRLEIPIVVMQGSGDLANEIIYAKMTGQCHDFNMREVVNSGQLVVFNAEASESDLAMVVRLHATIDILGIQRGSIMRDRARSLSKQ